MRYYSDTLKKMFNTMEECECAEREYALEQETKHNKEAENIEMLAVMREHLKELEQKRYEIEQEQLKCRKEFNKKLSEHAKTFGRIPKEYADLNFLFNFL